MVLRRQQRMMQREEKRKSGVRADSRRLSDPAVDLTSSLRAAVADARRVRNGLEPRHRALPERARIQSLSYDIIDDDK